MKSFYSTIGHIIMISVCLLFFFSGCGIKAPDEASTHKSNDEESIIENGHIVKYVEKDGVSLSIDADVVRYGSEMPQAIVLKKNNVTSTILSDLKNNLFFSPSYYTEIVESGVWILNSDGKLCAGLYDDGLLTTYENYETNVDGRYLEETLRFRYQGFSDTRPGNISFDAQIAADEASQYFLKYSDFEFLPHKVLAAVNDETGYYSVHLYPIYHGTPVCISTSFGCDVGVHASVSEDGITYFQGCFAFEEVDRRDLESLIPVETVIDQFVNSFFDISEYSAAINKISIEFVFTKKDDGLYELVPGYCFYGEICTGTDVENVPYDEVFCYLAEDGLLYNNSLIF